MTELVTLLPLVQLPDGVGPCGTLLWGEAEVAQAVLSVLVLANSCGRGAVARSLWQGLVCIYGGVLGLSWWCTAGEGVVSGWGAIE